MIDKARLAATKEQSRSTDASSPSYEGRQPKQQSLLTGTVTTQVLLRVQESGAIQRPLVGTGTFQSNSPVGIGSQQPVRKNGVAYTSNILTKMKTW
jgi:hypothetical protein